MNTPSEETPVDGKQRRKSIDTGGGSNLAGGKTRRYSIGITSSQKTIGEEINNVPNYLRASTGSCHDFCKYGKHHEHSKSSIPIKFKRSTIVNKEKVTRTLAPVETKKTTPKPSTDPKTRTSAEPIVVTKKDVSLPSNKTQVSKRVSSTNGKSTENELKMTIRSISHVKSSPVMVTRDASSGSNGGINQKGTKTVKKTGMTPKTTAVNKVVAKGTATESQSPKASFSRAASLKKESVKKVSPLKDQNRMQKTEPKITIDDKVKAKTLHGVEAESEVKPETMEFDFIHPSMELINDPVCNSSESFSGTNVVEKELTIIHPVDESSELFPDKELLEESSIALPAIEKSESCSDKEVLEEKPSIAPPVSESSLSSYELEVLEDESEYTVDDDDDDDEEVEVEVSEEESESNDHEKVFATANNDEIETSVGNHTKIPRKGRMVISQDKDDEAVKLRFRRGKVLDVQSENNGPRRLKFRRRVVEGNEVILNGPRRLKFTKGKVMEGNEDKKHIARRSFEMKNVEETDDSKIGHESVVLKHQGEQGKRDAQGLFNNVIEETASKLVESRKSKVKALVGAFETVISLQDGKPSST